MAAAAPLHAQVMTHNGGPWGGGGGWCHYLPLCPRSASVPPGAELEQYYPHGGQEGGPGSYVLVLEGQRTTTSSLARFFWCSFD